MKKYPVVTLCGSTRFKREFIEVQKKLTLEGKVVISVGLFGHSGDDEVWEDMPEDTITETKHMLDDIHKQKIEMADSIYVINPGGYIGKSTWSEISYAYMLGKKMEFYEPASWSDVEYRVRCRLDAAEEFAWQSLDGLRHQGEYADMTRHPSFVYKGKTIYDPWISPDAHYDGTTWADHKDPAQRVDPFKTYGKKNMARFVEEILYLYGKNDFY